LFEARDGLRASQLDAGQHRLLHTTSGVVELIAQFRYESIQPAKALPLRCLVVRWIEESTRSGHAE